MPNHTDTAETPYVETEALLAVMRGDEDDAVSILDDMLPGERRDLVRHLDRLSLLARRRPVERHEED